MRSAPLSTAPLRGRVLASFEAGPDERGALSGYLDRIGYRYWEETGNPAYELFLR